MNVQKSGNGELMGWEHPDDVREWNRTERTRAMEDKRMSAAEAVEKYIDSGETLVSGGFGHVRISTPILHEIIRQDISELGMFGKTAVFDLDLLIAAGAICRVEAAYSFAHETRGLAPASRRKIEGGDVDVVAEASNAALQWRFLAGKMGLPFIPARIMNGTDTFERSSAKVVNGPWTDEQITLLPAANPDTAIIHAHRADKYGNTVIDGISVEDPELAGAAKRVIVTAEQIVDSSKIRDRPKETEIPFFQVDAVVEAPYGSHPGEMPTAYYFDEDHIAEWLELSETESGVDEYLDRYVTGTEDFAEYLEAVGGEEKIAMLESVEQYETEAEYPWA